MKEIIIISATLIILLLIIKLIRKKTIIEKRLPPIRESIDLKTGNKYYESCGKKFYDKKEAIENSKNCAVPIRK